MRDPVALSTWLKAMLLRLTAETSFTGTLRRPIVIEPVQIERAAIARSYPARCCSNHGRLPGQYGEVFLELTHRVAQHERFEHHCPCPTGSFGPVQGDVRVAEQLIGCRPPPSGDPDAG